MENVITPSEFEIPYFPNPDGEVVAYELLRSANTASLSTHDPVSAFPFCTLVNVAASFDGSPLIYVSNLSLHTRNILANPKVSLLISPAAKADLPRTTRITVVGNAVAMVDPIFKERFNTYNPSYADYPAVGGFYIFKIEVLGVHFVDGAGGPSQLALDRIVNAHIESCNVTEIKNGRQPKVNDDLIQAVERILETRSVEFSNPPSILSVDPDGVLVNLDGKLRFLKQDTSPDFVGLSQRI